MIAKKINQKEIAKKLNVSPATVSLVLSDPETTRASKRTKSRIFEMASSSVIGASRADTLLMLIEEEALQFYYGNNLLSGAQARVAELGLKLEIITPKQDIFPILATRRVRGLLVASPGLLEGDAALDLVLPLRTVSLNIARHFPFKGIGVMSDLYDGMLQAMQRLKEAGHERIAFIGYKEIGEEVPCRRTKERMTIFREAADAHDLDLEKLLVHLIHDTRKGAVDRTEEIASFVEQFKSQDRPTAVVAFNDIMAAKIIYAALHEGISVPKELSVVGIDNEPLCKSTLPPISSISPEFKQMGRTAVNLLYGDHIWHEEDRPSRVVIPSVFHDRASIAANPLAPGNQEAC